MSAHGRLEGRVGIVTGAAGGMGAAHVTRLAGEGATVYAADIHQEGLERTTAATPDRTRGRLLDVTSADAWSALVTDVMTHHGRIDFLVNNAGVVQLADAVETSEAEWDRTMAINAKGVFLGMKHVVPVMQRQGAGSIVNISSVYGLVGTSGYVAYTASKGAVTVMTKAAAAAHGPAGIRVNSVHPGVVYTPMLETELSGLPASALEDFLAATPLRRGAAPDEVSGAVLFLVSDDSSFVSGAEIVVDGGLIAAR
ncbi:MAG: glucose 1-dehydrogenase [Microbacterium sp.]|nr:glucose 1-dehydrogenase [Microbacterium sp.]